MQVTDVLFDPDLGRSAFTVERLTYIRSAEGTSLQSQTFSAISCVHHGTSEMILLLTEEMRHETYIEVFTDFALSLGEDSGSAYTGPDRIHWNGEIWRDSIPQPQSAQSHTVKIACFG